MPITLTDRPPRRRGPDGREEGQHHDGFLRGGAPSDRAETTSDASHRVEDGQHGIRAGVIAEARRRTRRRRVAYGVATVAAIALGISVVISMGGQPEPPRETISEEGGAPWPAEPADDDAGLVAEWVQFHAGWAYVYDDGRVIWRTDGGRITQQRLSPEGLDLVREGKIDPAAFIRPTGEVPASVWAAPQPIEFHPARVAICPVAAPSDHAVAGPPADEVEALLPEPVRTLIAGSAGDFRHGDWGGTAGPGGPAPVQTCFLVEAERAKAVWAQTDADPGSPGFGGELQLNDAAFGTLALGDGTSMQLWFQPILPHGVGGSWGG